jgi:hypothetical protein
MKHLREYVWYDGSEEAVAEQVRRRLLYGEPKILVIGPTQLHAYSLYDVLDSFTGEQQCPLQTAKP